MHVQYRISRIQGIVTVTETTHISDNKIKSKLKLFRTEITMEVIAAQAFAFFLAGFETSSTAITLCLYELALNPEIQERVRNEIDTVLEKQGGNLTYDSIFEMEYLEKVVDGKRTQFVGVD